jgi:beta-mannosidase
MHETLSLDGDWRYETTDGQTGEMTIPSNWYLAGLPDHAGTVTFRRAFRLDALPEGKRATLRFLGVDYRAQVWLNDILLGVHEGSGVVE